MFSKPKPKKTKKRMKDWAGVGRKGGRGAERAFFFLVVFSCLGLVPGQDIS